MATIIGLLGLQLINSVVILVILSMKENKPLPRVFADTFNSEKKKVEEDEFEEANDEQIISTFKSLQKTIEEIE